MAAELDPPPRRGGRSRARSADGAGVLTVAELTRHVGSALEGLGRVSVEGEVSRVVRASSGHLYFDLKDLDARLGCIVWRSQVDSAVRFDLSEGQLVVAHGRLDVYPPRGSYSLVVQRLEREGIGAMLERLERLKVELREQGWFDRVRPLPPLPRVVGVVTSRDGAALQDFLRTRSLRWPLYPVRLAHTPVQGPGAAEEVARAIARLDASGVDVIVVCRGGGSLEDLWAFNELPVAKAIREAGVPVVTGIGHETDLTLADLVADQRAHTPTDAAQTVLPDRSLLLEGLERLAGHLGRAIDDVLGERAERLERLAASGVLRRPQWILGEAERRAADLGHRLGGASRHALDVRAARLSAAARGLASASPALALERRAARVQAAGLRLCAAAAPVLEQRERRLALAGTALEAISPTRVLERGYSITRSPGGGALRDASDLRPGDLLETRLARGRVSSTVTTVGEDSRPDPSVSDSG